MPQRNVASNFTFEQQRVEINNLAQDFWTQKGTVDTAAPTYLKHDGSNDFTGQTLAVPNAFTINANSGNGTVTISGNLNVSGTTTTVSSTNLEVTDKNILIAKGSTSDANSDGAGITIDSATDITFNFVDANDALVSSIGLEATDHLKAARGQFTGSTTPTTGSGVEVNAPDANTGQIIAYNRGTPAYNELRLRGSSVPIYTGSTNALVGTFNSTGLSMESGKTITGVIATASQPNITSVGTLTGLDLSGNITQTTSSNGQGISINGANNSSALTFDANRGTQAVLGVVYGRWNGTTVAQMSFVTGDDGTDKNDGYITFGTESAASNGNVNATERLRITSDGKFFMHGSNATSANNTSALLPAGQTLNIHGTGSNDGISVVRYSASYGAYGINIGRSRNDTFGANTAVQSDDELGHVTFYGADGTNFDYAAQITGLCDGEVGTGGDATDMPGALSFRTTPEGSDTPTEKLRINSDGIITQTATHPQIILKDPSDRTVSLRSPSTSNKAALGTDSNHALIFYTNGYSNERLRITNDGKVGINIDDNTTADLHVRTGNNAAGLFRLGGGTGGATGLDIDYTNSGTTKTIIKQNYRSTNGDAELSFDSGLITFMTGTTGNDERLRINKNGYITTPTSSPIASKGANSKINGGFEVYNDQHIIEITDSTNSYHVMRSWRATKWGEFRVEFEAMIQSGAYYFAYDIFNSTQGKRISANGTGNEQVDNLNNCRWTDYLDNGFTSSVHAMKRFSVTCGADSPVAPGDVIQLRMASCDSGGTLVTGNGQTLKCEHLQIFNDSPGLETGGRGFQPSPVAFHAVMMGMNQTFSTNTDLTWNNGYTAFNRGYRRSNVSGNPVNAGFDLDNSRFIVPYTGIYAFYVNMFVNTASSCRMAITIDGAAYQSGYIWGCNSDEGQSTPNQAGFQTVYLGAGSNIKLRIVSGSLDNTYGGHTSWGGWLIG